MHCTVSSTKEMFKIKFQFGKKQKKHSLTMILELF